MHWSSGATLSFILPINNKLRYRPNTNDFHAVVSADRIVSDIQVTKTVENIIEKLKIQKNLKRKFPRKSENQVLAGTHN